MIKGSLIGAINYTLLNLRVFLAEIQFTTRLSFHQRDNKNNK